MGHKYARDCNRCMKECAALGQMTAEGRDQWRGGGRCAKATIKLPYDRPPVMTTLLHEGKHPVVLVVSPHPHQHYPVDLLEYTATKASNQVWTYDTMRTIPRSNRGRDRDRLEAFHR